MKPQRMIILLICLIATTPAWAGVLMTMTDQHSDRAQDQSVTKLYLDQACVRMEMTGKEENQVVIYRQDKNLFWIINTKDKSYTEFTKADLDQMQQQIEGASTEMEEALKSMPAAQRKMMEEAMKSMIPSSPPKVIYKKVASGDKVNQWTCTQYEGSLEGKKESDVWTTDWKSLGLTQEDFVVLKEMSKFFEGIAKSGSSFLKIDEAEQETEGHYAGVPVKTVHFAKGKPAGSTEMQSVERQDFDKALFDLPSGLKKEELPQGRMEE